MAEPLSEQELEEIRCDSDRTSLTRQDRLLATIDALRWLVKRKNEALEWHEAPNSRVSAAAALTVSDYPEAP